MDFKSVFAFTLLASLTTSKVNASVLIAFPSTNTPDALVPSELAPPLTPFNLRRGSGLSMATGTTFNSKHWSEDSMIDAIAAEDYLTWGFRSDSPFQLEQLSLRYDRSASGPQQIAVQLSRDDDAFETVWTDLEVADNSTDFHEIELSMWPPSTSVWFRMVGWNAAGLTGTFDIENYQITPVRAIAVTGTFPTSPVPEPATAQAWGLVAIGCLILRIWHVRNLGRWRYCPRWKLLTNSAQRISTEHLRTH